jgi:hypothetical protein
MSDKEEPLRCLLRKNSDYLIHELRVSLYINILFDQKVLSMEDKEWLRGIPSRGNQAEKFVDIMLRKPESSIQKFLDILRNHEDKQPQIYKRLFRDSKQEQQSQRAKREHEVAANLEEDPEWDSVVTPRLPDVVKALRPTLLLDDLRAARILSRTEYSELLEVSTEEMRSRRLLNNLLPRKNGSFSNFCKILLKVEGQEHIVTEILKIGVSQTTSAAKDKEDKDLPMVTGRNQTHVDDTSASGASSHQSAVQQPSSMQRKEDLECNSEQNASYNFTERGKRKQDVMDGSFAKRSKKEHVEQHCSPVRSQKQSSDKVTTTTEIQGSPGIMVFFKTEHFDRIEEFETAITSACAKCYGILEKKVTLVRAKIAEMEGMVESWKKDDAYRVYMDCESILAVIRVSGGDKEDMLDSDKKRMLEEFIVDLLKDRDPRLTMDDCKIVEAIRCSLFIVFKLSTELGIHLLCALGNRLSLKSLRNLLKELFPRSTGAALRLGGLPSLPLFSTEGDNHVQKGESRESVSDDKNEGSLVSIASGCRTYWSNQTVSSSLKEMILHSKKLKSQVQKGYDLIDDVDNTLSLPKEQLELMKSIIQDWKGRIIHKNEASFAKVIRARFSLISITKRCLHEVQDVVSEAGRVWESRKRDYDLKVPSSLFCFKYSRGSINIFWFSSQRYLYAVARC